jgi:hypothetical protein
MRPIIKSIQENIKTPPKTKVGMGGLYKNGYRKNRM